MKEVDDGFWTVSFMRYDLGAENLATPRQPVRSEVVTHVLGTIRYPCLRAGHRNVGDPGRTRTSDQQLRRFLL